MPTPTGSCVVNGPSDGSLSQTNAPQTDRPPAFQHPAQRAELLLALVPDVGPLLRSRLLETFGNAQNVLETSADQLRGVSGIGPKIADQIVRAHQLVDLDAIEQTVRKHGLSLLLESDPHYPRLLREIPDPPGVLFLNGTLLPVDQLAIAIVGTRRASRYGIAQTERLAAGLARAGVTIVSGMARGIDAAAHRGALAANGRTLAVSASGVLKPYPPEHADLARQIAASGAVLGESPPEAPPLKGMFPQRNRIISGLAMGTLVVEAGDRSGALITARLAMEQGRDVFAMPGQIDNPTARGPHRLISDGAKLTTCVDDILESLGPLVEQTAMPDGRIIRSPAELQLNEIEQRILQAIPPEGVRMDDVALSCGLPVQRVLAVATVLEARRLVRKTGGSRVARV